MKRLHPQTALLLAFQAAVLALVLERPANLLALAGAAALYWLAVGGRRHWAATLLLLLLGTWSLMLSQGLFYEGVPRTAWLRLLPPEAFPFGRPAGLYLYREGLLHGLLQSLRIHTALLLGVGLLTRYGTDELAAGLRAAGVPGAVCFLASLALRYVPLLLEDVRALWLAQRLRGLRLGVATVGGLPRLLLLPLLAATVRRADEVAAALLSRGFSPAAPPPAAPRAPLRQRALAWAGALLLVSLIAAQTLTRLHQSGALSLRALEGLYIWVAEHV
jgi:energy-coupling factor transport system permease protein